MEFLLRYKDGQHFPHYPGNRNSPWKKTRIEKTK